MMNATIDNDKITDADAKTDNDSKTEVEGV